MPVLVVGGETTLAALDRRLFKSGVPADAIARVHKAIRDENPDVDFDHLRPGLVLRLPRLPELKARADLSFDGSVAEAVSATGRSLESDLKDLEAAARDRLGTDAEERRALSRQLESREVQAAASKDDGVMAALRSAQEGIAEDEAADERRRAVVEQAVAEWTGELPTLDRLLP